MRDFIERMEDTAERQYYDMLQDDRHLKCPCGRIFNPDDEGGTVSPNPYAMPVCGVCLESAMEAASQDANMEMVGYDADFDLGDIGNKQSIEQETRATKALLT